jgi:uncharacterized membrane protein
MAVKHITKKTWVWLKHYWYIPAVLVYTLVLIVATRRNTSAALEVLAVSKESYEKQVSVLNKTHEDEIQKRDKIVEKYNKVISEIDANRDNDLVKLDKDKKKRIKKLIEDNHEEPERLSRLLSITFGVPYEEG